MLDCPTIIIIPIPLKLGLHRKDIIINDFINTLAFRQWDREACVYYPSRSIVKEITKKHKKVGWYSIPQISYNQGKRWCNNPTNFGTMDLDNGNKEYRPSYQLNGYNIVGTVCFESGYYNHNGKTHPFCKPVSYSVTKKEHICPAGTYYLHRQFMSYFDEYSKTQIYGHCIYYDKKFNY